MSNFYVHFPVISVMGLFLAAFLVEIFGSKNKYVRYIISLIACLAAAAMTFYLIVPVFLNGEVISYWMGAWAPEGGYAFGIGYEIDGLGLFFGLLTALTFLMSVIFSWRYMSRDGHLGHYYTLFLMLAGSVLGLVFTGDVFNLFIMIEIMTFASVALTAFRHKKHPEALEGAFKYLVLGSIGSSMTLLGVALLYLTTHTLNMAQITALISSQGMQPTTLLAFGTMLAGLAVKSFVVPFHTPAADAYATAPASVSTLFSGMVNKAGIYGIIRLTWILFRAMDKEALMLLLSILGALTMFIGVTMALAQHDFKRLLAFHSISQIGYVLMAVGLGTNLGLYGGLFHAMNHTLFKGLLFLTAGAVYYATGTTNLDKLGGLAKRMPYTTVCFLAGAFAISGIPPFNGFASKWIIYQAAYEKALLSGNIIYLIITVVALLVSVMTLASFIKVTSAVFFGQTPASLERTGEVPFSMQLPMFIMSALCLAAGLFYNKTVGIFVNPAVNAATDPAKYVDTMMGDGYAFSHGIAPQPVTFTSVSIWDPVFWLILFVIVTCAVTLVAMSGARERGPISLPEKTADDKHATFFGGEKSLHSHVGGSDLFWGFKKDLKGYFRVMDDLHSGRTNDYALWVVLGTALITLFTFIFMS
jgi:multicomponent Na+:H+ antiporter subunit D